MLSNSLNTNEIKDASGTVVPFERRTQDGAQTEYICSTQTPNHPHNFSVKHTEVGSGIELRRRSAILFNLAVTGVSGLPRTHKAQFVIDSPIGDIANYTDLKTVIAELVSFVASVGTNTTIKYDCSGNGALCLVNGTI